MKKYIFVISVLIGSVMYSQEIIHTEKDSTGDYIRYIEYYRKGSRGLIKTKKETYYSNGVMSSELYFRNGKEHGLNRGWYEDGSRGFEFSYKRGKLEGLSTEWDYDGNKISEVIYEKGKLISKKRF
ncbi:hypothetical protein N9E12_01675 [Candidatus Marinimicrobia bacterium]|jgi:antitoxin component YwqK of YwqJK toxin-antitoxin module|nr:hypothetical protein [Candidatus Neomarinimicrobiota bacterium]|tara:strand:+ start:368 stop:745 length:378 start_codon:yes stop_codon:yes gene_type:complete